MRTKTEGAAVRVAADGERRSATPLFQDLQTTILPEEPVGSQSEESLDEGEQTEAPAA